MGNVVYRTSQKSMTPWNFRQLTQEDLGKNFYDIYNLSNFYYTALYLDEDGLGMFKMPSDFVVTQEQIDYPNDLVSGVDYNQSILPVACLLIFSLWKLKDNKNEGFILFCLCIIIFTQLGPPSDASSSPITIPSFPLDVAFQMSENEGISTTVVEVNGKTYEQMYFKENVSIPLHIHDYDVKSMALTDGLSYTYNGIDWITWPKNKIIQIGARRLHAVRSSIEGAQLVTNTKGDILLKATYL